jgi:folylpolyglutamate synthase/dihydropteroate synthase
MLPGLLSIADAAVLTQPPSAPGERRWKPRQVAAALAPRFTLEVEADFGLALARVAEWADGGTAVVTGSCHTVGSALGELGIQPFPTPFPV